MTAETEEPTNRTMSMGEAFSLAVELYGKGDLENSANICRQIVAAAPDMPGALHLLGLIALRQGRPGDALEPLRKAAGATPADADLHMHIGMACKALGDLEGAAASFQQAASIRPDDPNAHNNLGNILLETGDVEAGMDCYRQAIAAQPENAISYNNLGAALHEQGKHDEAIASLERAIELDSDYEDARYNLASAHFNRGQQLLSCGRYKEGWEDYEWRLRMRDSEAAGWDYPKPVWDGSGLEGKTLLLVSEQGVGDTIQFIRFIPQVAALGGRVILGCQRSLASLVDGLEGLDQVITDKRRLPNYDVWLPVMSLARVLGITEATIPAPPYLTADPDRSREWRRRFDDEGGVCIGLVWTGNPLNSHNVNRSIPVECLKPLLEIPGTRFYSLQFGDAVEDLSRFPPGKVVDLVPELDDFASTAAVLSALDLLITIDTASAHLAGALTSPVWTVLCHTNDWRWLRNREDSPWYPNMRLFRQNAPGEWPEVIARVGEALREFIAR